MGVMANVLQRSADQQGGEFNSRPFFRICLGFISELAPSDPSDAIGFGMVAALATVLHALQVSQGLQQKVPWLGLLRGLRAGSSCIDGNLPAWQHHLVSSLLPAGLLHTFAWLCSRLGAHTWRA